MVGVGLMHAAVDAGSAYRAVASLHVKPAFSEFATIDKLTFGLMRALALSDTDRILYSFSTYRETLKSFFDFNEGRDKRKFVTTSECGIVIFREMDLQGSIKGF